MRSMGAAAKAKAKVMPRPEPEISEPCLLEWRPEIVEINDGSAEVVGDLPDSEQP